MQNQVEAMNISLVGILFWIVTSNEDTTNRGATWEICVLQEEDPTNAEKEAKFADDQEKGDTSHETRKKHRLQLFKNFWNDTFENSIPSINLNISTILICFRFTSHEDFVVVREAERCILLKYGCVLHVWPSIHLPSCNSGNQLGNKQIDSWQLVPLSCQPTFSHYIYVFINFSTVWTREKTIFIKSKLAF